MSPERRITRSHTAAQRPLPTPRSPSPSPSSSSSSSPDSPPNIITLDVLKPGSLPSSREPSPDSDNDSSTSSSLSALSSAAAQSEPESSAPTPAAAPTTAPSKVPNSAKSDTHPKKKRKTSPPPPSAPTTTVQAAPPLVRTTSTPKAPTTATTGKSKAPRVSTVGASVPTRTQKALLIRESNSTSRAGSQHVVEDDSPLPPPPSRTGMGEGAFPTPKDSYLRHDNLLMRKEAEYIIKQAELHRREVEKRKDRDERNGTMLVEGKRNRRSVNYNEDGDGDIDMSEDEGGSSEGGGPGPSTSRARLKRRQSQLNGHNGNHQDFPTPNENVNGGRRRSSTLKFPEPIKDQSFEGQFNQLQRERKAQVLAEKAAERSGPPVFPKNARPTVVLANGTINGIGGRTVPRDRTERSYQEGLSGLSNEMEIDAQGFVDNVKENLRAILKYYFPERSPRRDAFCERIGRGLAQLGWELTDNSDAALLP
ncbi:hypothetical protein I302_102855 [Kwoniella bestiolae CBS 10118]|uniref:Uncharacterized protein n=1 Tax=Kwoniella bestiolae CBS 10118 TaxID=1296100 RepID=A0A1B9GG46_9TREE|nr:hypothetical protein I302_01550 [Kwoniella bestiolae CBS 10118]OCF30032.1 hypothetical protein I302_01550 [Kwoniella bestiolae CBS 10118]